jgi:hypothetical protein
MERVRGPHTRMHGARALQERAPLASVLCRPRTAPARRSRCFGRLYPHGRHVTARAEAAHVVSCVSGEVCAASAQRMFTKTVACAAGGMLASAGRARPSAQFRTVRAARAANRFLARACATTEASRDGTQRGPHRSGACSTHPLTRSTVASGVAPAAAVSPPPASCCAATVDEKGTALAKRRRARRPAAPSRAARTRLRPASLPPRRREPHRRGREAATCGADLEGT